MTMQRISDIKDALLRGWQYSVLIEDAIVMLLSPEAAHALNALAEDFIHETERIVKADGTNTLASYLAAKERTPRHRAPFGPPSISPSGIPLHEQTGAIPSVRIDADDSNDAHLGEADTGQVEIFTETDKGDQE